MYMWYNIFKVSSININYVIQAFKSIYIIPLNSICNIHTVYLNTCTDIFVSSVSYTIICRHLLFESSTASQIASNCLQKICSFFRPFFNFERVTSFSGSIMNESIGVKHMACLHTLVQDAILCDTMYFSDVTLWILEKWLIVLFLVHVQYTIYNIQYTALIIPSLRVLIY